MTGALSVTVDPALEEALAQLDGMPAPFPDFSAALRQIAAGQTPSVPASLPAELQALLNGILTALEEAKGQ